MVRSSLAALQLFQIQYVAVLQPYVVFFVEETFSLYPGHVEDVHPPIASSSFSLPSILRRHYPSLILYIVRNLQLLWRNQDEADTFIADHGLDQGMNGPSELQVAAEPDGHVVQTGLSFSFMGQDWWSGSGSDKEVASVSCVDDRNGGSLSSDSRSAFLQVAHGDDIQSLAYCSDCIADVSPISGGAEPAF